MPVKKECGKGGGPGRGRQSRIAEVNTGNAKKIGREET